MAGKSSGHEELDLSAHYEIFTKPSNNELDLIEDIQRITGKGAEDSISRNGGTGYLFDLGNYIIDVELTHDYDDDHGIPFSKYPIVVTIRDLGSDRRREESTARKLFEALHREGRYNGVLVYDFRQLLAER